MNPLRKAIGLSVLLLLLFTSACGGAAGPAATAAPAGSDYNLEPVGTYEAAATEAPASAPEQSAQSWATEQPDDMFFEDYGVNPSIDTENDNLSTFALD